MTEWVELRQTGNGSSPFELAAANGYRALSETVTTEPGDEWASQLWYAALHWLLRWPEPDRGDALTVPAPRPGEACGFAGAPGSIEPLNVATVAVAHWGLETGWGRFEYNFNSGGIHCLPGADACFREAQSAGGEEFLAFTSRTAFLREYFELVAREPRYASAWRAMRAGSANGIMELWRAGYSCGRKTRSESTSLVSRVRRVVRENSPNCYAPLLAPDFEATAAEVPNRCRDGEEDRGPRGGSGGGGGSRRTIWPVVVLLGAALAANK